MSAKPAKLSDERFAEMKRVGNSVRCSNMHGEFVASEIFDHIDALTAENERLRQRLLTAAGDDLCRLSQDEIKDLTGGKVPIPPKEEFLASCERFHDQIAGEGGVNRSCLTLAQLVAENERLTRELGESEELAKRLAGDAMIALAGSKIATPEEGYLRAPHCLGDDIKRLRKERDAAQQRLAALAVDPTKREELALGAWRIWYGAYFGTLPRWQFADISDAGKAAWLSIVDYLVPVVAASRDAEVAELQRQLAEATKRLAELTKPANAIELRKIAWANYGAIYAQQKGEPLEPYESSTPERRARIDKAADAVAARVRAPLVQQIAELEKKLSVLNAASRWPPATPDEKDSAIMRLATELKTAKQALAELWEFCFGEPPIAEEKKPGAMVEAIANSVRRDKQALADKERKLTEALRLLSVQEKRASDNAEARFAAEDALAAARGDVERLLNAIEEEGGGFLNLLEGLEVTIRMPERPDRAWASRCLMRLKAAVESAKQRVLNHSPAPAKADASEHSDSSHTPETAHASSSQSDPADHSGDAGEKAEENDHPADWSMEPYDCPPENAAFIKEMLSEAAQPERRFVCPVCRGMEYTCRDFGLPEPLVCVEAAKDGPITAATTDIRKIAEKSNATDAANQAAEVEAAKGEETKDNRRLGHRQIDDLRARAFCCASDVNDAIALLNDRDAILVELEALKQQLAAANQAREAAEKALAEIWGECCPDCGPQQYELFAGLLSKMTEEQRQRAEAAEAAAGVMKSALTKGDELNLNNNRGVSVYDALRRLRDGSMSTPDNSWFGWAFDRIDKALAADHGRAANELRAGKALAGKIRDALCSVEAIAHVERALADYDQALAQGE